MRLDLKYLILFWKSITKCMHIFKNKQKIFLFLSIYDMVWFYEGAVISNFVQDAVLWCGRPFSYRSNIFFILTTIFMKYTYFSEEDGSCGFKINSKFYVPSCLVVRKFLCIVDQLGEKYVLKLKKWIMLCFYIILNVY